MELVYNKAITFPQSLKNTVSCFDNLIAAPSPENTRVISLWEVDDDCKEPSSIVHKIKVSRFCV